MDYAAARDAFFGPPAAGAPVVPPVVAVTTPARALRDAVEPIATQPIWSPDAHERYAALGLNFLSGYVGERAAALGAAPTRLVVSAFGVFAPGLLGGLYEEATRVPREEMVTARIEGATRTVRRALDGVDDATVTAAVTALRTGTDAADATARPLFAGLSDRTPPEDPVGALVHAADLFREHRGDSHLAACAVAGLDPVEANILTELHSGFPLLSYTATRGWTEEQMDAAADRLRGRGLLDGAELSEQGRAFRERLEEQTDAMQQTIITAIGDRLGELTATLAGWSATIVDAGLFPPDPSKRAAG